MQNIQLNHDSHIGKKEKHPLCFLLHDMDVPMNIGSLFRIADALGVEKLFLTGRSVVPPNTKIKKTSRSTEKYVEYEYHPEPQMIIKSLKSLGYKIISLEITSTSIEIEKLEIDNADKICLILGSENHGINQELLSLSDTTVHIPMVGVNSSMNVASACSIATYEIIRKLKSSS